MILVIFTMSDFLELRNAIKHFICRRKFCLWECSEWCRRSAVIWLCLRKMFTSGTNTRRQTTSDNFERIGRPTTWTDEQDVKKIDWQLEYLWIWLAFQSDQLKQFWRIIWASEESNLIWCQKTQFALKFVKVILTVRISTNTFLLRWDLDLC